MSVRRIRLKPGWIQEAKRVYAETGSVKETAKICSEKWGEKIPRTTMSSWLVTGDVPLSEDVARFHEEWTPEDCITELQRIAEIEPEKVITRNFFRNHSTISESTWNRYFGTFREFKRQAGITLSRHQHRVELQIARHASADSYRVINEEKAGWEDKYERPDSKRFQTILVGSDIHDTECDPFWRDCFIDAAKRVQPEIVCLNGDVFCLPEFSRFTTDPRDFDAVGRIAWVHDFLTDLREAVPSAHLDLIEGNHEFRLVRHLAEASPAMRAVLSDLHGMTVADLLGLDKFEVNYIARSDLATFTERDLKNELKRNWKVYFDSVLAHHFPEGRRKGFPGWNGHHHKHVVWTASSPIFGAFEWHQVGCGHARDATYCDGENWSNGFLLAHIDTQEKRTAFEYIDTTHGHAVIGGRWYCNEAATGD